MDYGLLPWTRHVNANRSQCQCNEDQWTLTVDICWKWSNSIHLSMDLYPIVCTIHLFWPFVYLFLSHRMFVCQSVLHLSFWWHFVHSTYAPSHVLIRFGSPLFCHKTLICICICIFPSYIQPSPPAYYLPSAFICGEIIKWNLCSRNIFVKNILIIQVRSFNETLAVEIFL